MSRWVKRILAVAAYAVMIGGPLLGLGMILLALKFRGLEIGAMAPLAVIYTLIGLTMGGILRLLVSIDDRLEQAARRASEPSGD